jgi:hypothetical protein
MKLITIGVAIGAIVAILAIVAIVTGGDGVFVTGRRLQAGGCFARGESAPGRCAIRCLDLGSRRQVSPTPVSYGGLIESQQPSKELECDKVVVG